MAARSPAIPTLHRCCGRIHALGWLAHWHRGNRRLETVGQLAGGVAHDFNNLLMVILGSAELLSSRAPKEPLLDAVRLAAERGADLTKQLLLIGRRDVIRGTVISINDAVQKCLALASRLLPTNIVINVSLDSAAWQILGDNGQAERIIMNLITNARDAIGEHQGSIAISTSNVTLGRDFVRVHPEVSPGEYVQISVADTGTGLTEEIQQRIFEPFFTTKQLGHGTGLGLSVVYGAVKQLGGSIHVRSAPGAGTTFDVYWPRSKEAATSSTGEDAAQVKLSVRRKLSILLVENEDDVRSTCAALLRSLGHEVVEAGHAAAALKLVRETSSAIDALVTDVVMPGMNGKELANEVLRLKPGTAVLFISGYSDNVILTRGLLKPGVILVRKPFGASEIQQGLQQALESAEKRPRLAQR